MQRDHPVESLKLISAHFTFDDWRIIENECALWKEENSQLGEDSKTKG
jgi:hypothetical protein